MHKRRGLKEGGLGGRQRVKVLLLCVSTRKKWGWNYEIAIKVEIMYRRAKRAVITPCGKINKCLKLGLDCIKDQHLAFFIRAS